jgi:hypothetical protein
MSLNMNENLIIKGENLLSKLYEKTSYNGFVVALDCAFRVFQRISRNDSVFRTRNYYLNIISCEDRLISTIFEYYLQGKGNKEDLNEDVFPLIHVLSGCENDETTKELKNLFLSVYS